MGANLASKALRLGAPRVSSAGAAAAATTVAGAAVAKVAAAAAANDVSGATPGAALDLWDTVALGFDGHRSEVVEEGEAPSIARAQKRREEREASNAERAHEAGLPRAHGSPFLLNASRRVTCTIHNVELTMCTWGWPWHKERQQLRVARVAERVEQRRLDGVEQRHLERAAAAAEARSSASAVAAAGSSEEGAGIQPQKQQHQEHQPQQQQQQQQQQQHSDAVQLSQEQAQQEQHHAAADSAEHAASGLGIAAAEAATDAAKDVETEATTVADAGTEVETDAATEAEAEAGTDVATAVKTEAETETDAHIDAVAEIEEKLAAAAAAAAATAGFDSEGEDEVHPMVEKYGGARLEGAGKAAPSAGESVGSAGASAEAVRPTVPLPMPEAGKSVASAGAGQGPESPPRTFRNTFGVVPVGPGRNCL